MQIILNKKLIEFTIESHKPVEGVHYSWIISIGEPFNFKGLYKDGSNKVQNRDTWRSDDVLYLPDSDYILPKDSKVFIRDLIIEIEYRDEEDNLVKQLSSKE
jgi:hypothetical protein